MRLAQFTDDSVQHTRSGQLQVCVAGAWGAVCDDTQFGFAEMIVACSHIMGFSETGMEVISSKLREYWDGKRLQPPSLCHPSTDGLTN